MPWVGIFLYLKLLSPIFGWSRFMSLPSLFWWQCCSPSRGGGSVSSSLVFRLFAKSSWVRHSNKPSVCMSYVYNEKAFLRYLPTLTAAQSNIVLDSWFRTAVNFPTLASFTRDPAKRSKVHRPPTKAWLNIFSSKNGSALLIIQSVTK